MTDESARAFYAEQLRVLIWSGFFNEDDFAVYLDDLTYDEQAVPFIDELRALGLNTIEEKRAAEAGWPARTDWDRLAEAFTQLERGHILATHNSGYTTSDAHHDAWQIIKSAHEGSWRGFAYYHGQDVERAVDGMPLFLGFDAVEDDEVAKREVGEAIATALRNAGFTVDWNSDPETRMSVTDVEWKKRTDWVANSGPEPQKGGFLRRLFGE